VSRRLAFPSHPMLRTTALLVTFSRCALISVNGIISHLTSVSCMNLHDLGVVVADASNVYNSPCAAKHALDLQNRNSYFEMQSQPNSWIRSDFKSTRVISIHYSIASHGSWGPCNNHPKSWCFEVSDDGDSWTEVHRYTDNNDLNGTGLIGTFAVTKSVKSRVIRLRQTGKNYQNSDCFLLSGLEIFGTLCDP
jgi:hypothetical protein